MFHRRDFWHIDLQETFEDPNVYARPWTISIGVDLVADTELLEYICNENEKDHQHLVGKASDDKKNAVKVAPAILSTYVGNGRIPSAGRSEFRDRPQRDTSRR